MCGNWINPGNRHFLGGPVGQTIAPIALSLLAPGLGTALGGALGATGAGASALGGGLIGAGFGGLTGGLSGALKGGVTGGVGGYLGGGGASDLFGGTGIGRTLGLANPEGGSTFGNLLGSEGASSGGSSLSNILSGSGLSNASSGFDNAPGISSSPSLGAPSASGLSGFGSNIASSIMPNASLASPSLSAGFGGASSAYGGAGASGSGSSYGGLGAILGGISSLNANDQAQKDLLKSQQLGIGQLQPYLDSGKASNARLSDLLGTSGNASATGYGSLSTPFTPQDLQSDPGYQFQLQQGEKALDRQQASKGDYFSGSALKAAQDYGQGLADTTYNNAFQRDQSTKAQQYGMFSGQSGAGQQAAGAAGNIYDNIGNARAGSAISSSNIMNQTLSSLLSGSGAKRPVNIGGQIVYM